MLHLPQPPLTTTANRHIHSHPLTNTATHNHHHNRQPLQPPITTTANHHNHSTQSPLKTTTSHSHSTESPTRTFTTSIITRLHNPTKHNHYSKPSTLTPFQFHSVLIIKNAHVGAERVREAINQIESIQQHLQSSSALSTMVVALANGVVATKGPP